MNEVMEKISDETTKLNLVKKDLNNGNSSEIEKHSEPAIDLFLENNLNSQEREAFLQEQIPGTSEEQASTSASDQVERRLGPVSPRKRKTQTAVVSEAFHFLRCEDDAEKNVELVRIPPEGCESVENVAQIVSNHTSDALNNSVIYHSHSYQEMGSITVDNLVCYDDDVVNCSRSSIEIDGCESESDVPMPKSASVTTDLNSTAKNITTDTDSTAKNITTISVSNFKIGNTKNVDLEKTDSKERQNLEGSEFNSGTLAYTKNVDLKKTGSKETKRQNLDGCEFNSDNSASGSIVKISASDDTKDIKTTSTCASNHKINNVGSNKECVVNHDTVKCNSLEKDLSNNSVDLQDSSESLKSENLDILGSESSSITTSPDQNEISAISEKEVVLRRQSDKKLKPISNAELSDDSSDEDSGIYAESHRNSTWIQVQDDEYLLNDTKNDKIADEPKSGELTNQRNSGTLLRLISEDDTVFSDGSRSLPIMGHKRSDSNTTTLSETEFKRERSFKSRRRCLIQRQESQQEYHRLSAKVYDQEKLIVVEKKPTDTDFGLHILDSHPAFITSVDPDSPAERCGIQEGQIVISVNGVNTLELSHEEIVTLVQKYNKIVRLEVAYSDFQPVRDLQKTVMGGYMLKLGTSTLVKMWKKRYFVLRQDNCLYYYKTDQELDPLGAIPLSGYCISRYTDTTKEFCFKAEKYGARTYYFMTDSREEMSQWVGVLTEAAARCKKRKDSWLEVSSHNVGLPALEIRKPECTGHLTKLGQQHKTWQKRYCVLKDGCIYYYKSMSSLSAKGVVHLHGYTVDGCGLNNKRFSLVLHPPSKNMRTFYFCADNQTDKQRWVDALTRSIQRWIRVDN
ncbi:uncharacterized protein LOC126823026 [Patella vulgata]|uniref:uncharacterized protein LOC126823026 n=1 Tax=Patella vulgata TaxID=6465 RepID=UPI0021808601|nr:uncharacterized protein LOC126823026 [Patella vulgata]